MKLYEIDTRIRAFWNKIMEQEGELTEEDIKELEHLEVEKTEKIKAYGVIIRELKADIDDCKAEKERIDQISKRLQTRQEWLKERLTDFMYNNNIDKYESTEVNISFRKSAPLEIDDINALPKEYLRITEKIEPDKDKIKNYLKEGKAIPGCRIGEKQNIQIK